MLHHNFNVLINPTKTQLIPEIFLTYRKRKKESFLSVEAGLATLFAADETINV